LPFFSRTRCFRDTNLEKIRIKTVRTNTKFAHELVSMAVRLACALCALAASAHAFVVPATPLYRTSGRIQVRANRVVTLRYFFSARVESVTTFSRPRVESVDTRSAVALPAHIAIKRYFNPQYINLCIRSKKNDLESYTTSLLTGGGDASEHGADWNGKSCCVWRIRTCRWVCITEIVSERERYIQSASTQERQRASDWSGVCDRVCFRFVVRVYIVAGAVGWVHESMYSVHAPYKHAHAL